MFALVFVALLGGASAQECIADTRLKAITKDELVAREDIQGFSRDGMWKMPKLAQHAREEQLEDCASCTDAEVQVELMQAQMGENPLLNELDGIYYPTNRLYATNGFQLSYKDIPHDVHPKVRGLLEHRAGSLELPIQGYRSYTENDAERISKSHEELQHLAPAGLGPFFNLAKGHKEDVEQGGKNRTLLVKEARRLMGEYASHVHTLRDIEKTTTKGSGVYLVLKDGFVMTPDFKSKYKKIVAEAPKDWDFLFLRTGPSKNTPVRCEDKVGATTQLYEMRRPVTTPDGLGKFYNGIDGYVVRRQSLPKILKLIKHAKAAPLSELLMSVHTEEKERQKDGKINYKVEGIYSYVINERMIEKVDLPKPVAPKKNPGSQIVGNATGIVPPAKGPKVNLMKKEEKKK